MTTEREQFCCRKLKAELRRCEAELGRVARQAIRRPSAAAIERIQQAKAGVARQREIVVDHEADHAGVPA